MPLLSKVSRFFSLDVHKCCFGKLLVGDQARKGCLSLFRLQSHFPSGALHLISIVVRTDRFDRVASTHCLRLGTQGVVLHCLNQSHEPESC